MCLIIQITGTWDNLIVRNLTTKQEFSLSQQTQPNTTIEIDSTLGQVRLQTGGLAANIHKGDFIYIQEAGLVKKLGVGNFVKNSIGGVAINLNKDEVLRILESNNYQLIENFQYKIEADESYLSDLEYIGERFHRDIADISFFIVRAVTSF